MAGAAGRPNVIVMLTDDQGPWAMGCAGNPEIVTPNLDRLAATGVRFSNYFCTSPVCSPARASLLTGRIPSQHGVHDWLRAGNSVCEGDRDGKLIEYLAGQRGYTEVLADAGYACGISGKWHLGDSHHAQKGLSFWKVHARAAGDYYGAPMVRGEASLYFEERYITDAITENGLDFLDGQLGSERPFYLSLHYTAPHSPWRRDQHPLEVFNDYYDNCAFASVPDVPRHKWGHAFPEFFEDAQKRREYLSGYFTATTAMDAGVGRVLDWLEAHGVREKTLVFFTSDNGMNMGHHGICGKGNGTRPLNMYDSSVKVPAIVSQPGRVATGVVSDAMVSHYDFMPTLLDYLGLTNPGAEALPGRSFAGMLETGRGRGDEEVVAAAEYGYVRMLRTRDWKYVHRYSDGPHELYDLARDPGEERNLLGHHEHAARSAEMQRRLEEWFSRYTLPGTDGRYLGVDGTGQTGMVGEQAEGRKAFGADEPSEWWPGGKERWMRAAAARED
jgi:choline-sulfatase